VTPRKPQPYWTPIDRLPPVLADAAYDADHFRAGIAKVGAIAVIPSNPSEPESRRSM
jgi:hypothetical protein